MAVEVIYRNSSRSGRSLPDKRNRKLNRLPQPVQGQVKILKRGEAVPQLPQNRPAQRPNSNPSPQVPDLGFTNRMRLDPKQVPILPTPVPVLPKPNRKQTKPADAKATAGFYAGSASCMASPPPSSLPLPSFFAKKAAAATTSSTDEAASVLLKLLRLNLS